MKNLFNAILRLAVKIALHVYFSQIKVYGKANIPKGKAVLIVSNHQNALIDPTLIATHTNLKPHFLTRASVFKKSFVATLLDFIRMIPIYRVRDGINNMEKNNETFDKSVNILLENGSIVIFCGRQPQQPKKPEASEKRIRPHCIPNFGKTSGFGLGHPSCRHQLQQSPLLRQQSQPGFWKNHPTQRLLSDF